MHYVNKEKIVVYNKKIMIVHLASFLDGVDLVLLPDGHDDRESVIDVDRLKLRLAQVRTPSIL